MTSNEIIFVPYNLENKHTKRYPIKPELAPLSPENHISGGDYTILRNLTVKESITTKEMMCRNKSHFKHVEDGQMRTSSLNVKPAQLPKLARPNY